MWLELLELGALELELSPVFFSSCKFLRSTAAMARTPTWRAALLTLLLVSALFLQAFVTPVVSSEAEDAEPPKSGEVVDEPVPEKVVEADLKAAPGVETSSFFPKNPSKVVKAGEPTQIDIDISNDGAAPLKVAYVRATLHLPHDHRLIVQNFTVQEGGNNVVSTGSKESINYKFSIIKFLQPGSYDFVGHVVYEVEGKAHRNVFHNGTIDVVEAGFFVKGETVFLATLGLGLLGLLGMWAYSKVQEFIKKQKRSSKKVETGTRTSSDAHTSEWLQGTSFNQKASRNIAQQRKAPRRKSSGSGNFSS